MTVVLLAYVVFKVLVIALSQAVLTPEETYMYMSYKSIHLRTVDTIIVVHLRCCTSF